MSIPGATCLGNLQVCRRPSYLNTTTRACAAPCTPVQSWVARWPPVDPAPPPPPLEGPFRWCALMAPLSTGARGCSVASGTSPAGPMGREALGATWDPSNSRGGTHRPWDVGLCRQATPPVPCGNQGVWGLPSRTSSPNRARAPAFVGRPGNMSV